jgi:hypothetical protein
MADLILPEDLAEAPRDGVGAFIYLERLARDRYQVAKDDAQNGAETTRFEFDYMSAVLAVASVHGVTELTGWQLPSLGAENWWQQCRDFRAAAEHVAYKLLLHRHRQHDAHSVALDAPTKLKLQHYVEQGRDLVTAADLTLPKRERLLGCLNVFQIELDRERTGLQVFGALASELASYASEAAGKLDGAVRVVERIGAALGWSRQAEDERERTEQLPAPPERKRIEALQRKRIEPPKRAKPTAFDKTIDDEIPF